MKDQRISHEELMALPEYSHSIPTGTTEGKRWRREHPDGWWIGEYYLDETVPEGNMGIRWTRAIIEEDDSQAHLQKWIEEIRTDILVTGLPHTFLQHLQKHFGPELMGRFLFEQTLPQGPEREAYWREWSASARNLLDIFDLLYCGEAPITPGEQLERLRDHARRNPKHSTPEPK